MNERTTVFGWVVHRKLMAAGETYQARVLEDIATKDSENIALWTKGLITGVREDGFKPMPRAPGHFNLDRDIMLAGLYTFTAKEDSEWWCVNWRLNRGDLPGIVPLRLSAGQRVALLPGTLLLVCSGVLQTRLGDLGQGVEVTVNDQVEEVSASSAGPVYGMIFDRVRA